MSIGTTLIRRIHVLDGGWQEELPSFEEEYGNTREPVIVTDGIRLVGDFAIYKNYKRFAILSDEFKTMATLNIPRPQARFVLGRNNALSTPMSTS